MRINFQKPHLLTGMSRYWILYFLIPLLKAGVTCNTLLMMRVTRGTSKITRIHISEVTYDTSKVTCNTSKISRNKSKTIHVVSEMTCDMSEITR